MCFIIIYFLYHRHSRNSNGNNRDMLGYPNASATIGTDTANNYKLPENKIVLQVYQLSNVGNILF